MERKKKKESGRMQRREKVMKTDEVEHVLRVPEIVFSGMVGSEWKTRV